MHPQKPDQPDRRRERPGPARHAPLHSRPTAAPAPPNVLAPDGERLAAGPVTAPEPDQDAERLRVHLETVRLRAQHAASWLETSSHFARLVNRDGVVPVTARFSAGDLAFLAEAREQMIGFADLGLRLIGLHQPLDACGVSSDPDAPILRCRSCMWRWPCPTFRTLTEVLDGMAAPAR